MKIRKKITSTCRLILLTGFSTISNAQQNRNVSDFTGIKAGDSFNIVIKQSEGSTVKIDADEKILSQIKTEVKDRILIISTEGNIKANNLITISIGIKLLKSLDISGSADVKSENQLACDQLNLASSGAGDMILDIKANEIKMQLSGAGDCTLKGAADLLDANVSGAGNLNASNLEVNKAKIKASGAGDAKVNVKQNLDADVSWAGSIIYKGNPVERNVSISGSGSVRESKIGTGEETASDTTKFKLGKKKYMRHSYCMTILSYLY